MPATKLVRDRIIEIIKAQGKDPNFYIAKEGELQQRICAKMNEEIQEFLEDPCLEEMADVYEVFMSIMRIYKFKYDDVVAAAIEKRTRRGGFFAGYVLL